MDIGTAKPTREEQSRVAHHLIDICDPSKGMDIGLYLNRAIEVIDAIRQRGKGDQGATPLDEFVANIAEEIRERRLPS